MSNTRFEFLPNDNIPEYAFIGRSNVGKSSLINMLVQRRGLAKTSSVPGKTVAINHFIINDSWYIVDLRAMVMRSTRRRPASSGAL